MRALVTRSVLRSKSMVMHYHFGVSPVNYSDYDSLHKVYLEYNNTLKMNFTVFKIEL